MRAAADLSKGKASPYSIADGRVPVLILVLCSQPAGDVSHKPAVGSHPADLSITRNNRAICVEVCSPIAHCMRALVLSSETYVCSSRDRETECREREREKYRSEWL